MGEKGDRRALDATTDAFRAGSAFAETLTDEDRAIVAGWSVQEARHGMVDGYRDGAELAEAVTEEMLEVIRQWALRMARAELDGASGPSDV